MRGAKYICSKIQHDPSTQFYRRLYAQLLYRRVAQDPMTLPREHRYYCHRDRKGTVLDHVAMQYVSRQLGHNRVSVIAQSYI